MFSILASTPICTRESRYHAFAMPLLLIGHCLGDPLLEMAEGPPPNFSRYPRSIFEISTD